MSLDGTLYDHPVMRQMCAMRSIDRQSIPHAFSAFIYLSEAKKWTLTVHESVELGWIYMVGRETPCSSPELVIPVGKHSRITAGNMSQCFDKLIDPASPGTPPQHLMMIVTTGDANITGYRVYNGIMPSSHRPSEETTGAEVTGAATHLTPLAVGVGKSAVHGVIVKDATSAAERQRRESRKKKKVSKVTVAGAAAAGKAKKKKVGPKGEWKKWIKQNNQQANRRRQQAMKR